MSHLEPQDILQTAEGVLQKSGQYLASQAKEGPEISSQKIDQFQTIAYDYAWLASTLFVAKALSTYAEKKSGFEKQLASLFLAETISEFSNKIGPHPNEFGLSLKLLSETLWQEEIGIFLSSQLNQKSYAQIAQTFRESGGTDDYGLDENHQMFRETFRKFADERVRPLVEKVHREDLLIPQEIIDGLRELGCFGLSMPERYGGFQNDLRPDNTGMVVVTEELSHGSLGIAGSLITRPEILSKALLKGGTEEQKKKWLPLLASGEKMCAVAVTEPDYGSDVASMKVVATPKNGGWLLNGVKTWCTFAGYADTLMVLARTDSDLSKRHRGLSLFIAEKPRFDGHSFQYNQPEGGHIEGKAIPTIGYRGMHSFEVSFENYLVSNENLIGGEKGLGQGFYLQMEGFAGGRLQTAARALGVMQAAFESALRYSNERKVFGKPIFEYGLTQWKLVRMAALVQASRQATYHAARLMDEGKGLMEASLVKFYASKVSEWVTREAMQIHGGYGYAEEYPVSRYFVDARVFSLFEGAEEVLALRVIAPSLLKRYL
ncbi:MAG: acyl-CoA/acyl-ACP dehydrogenase [Deltaproteobacteria bacterium]|nr:acyl-CoA/acyl-ACP dehydrogenase [Deltaproteobacteria bacterium]